MLTKSKEEGWWYQYWLKWKDRENHKQFVRDLLKYVDDLMLLTECPIIWLKKELVISILSYTSSKKRNELHTNIIGAVDTFLLKEFWTTWKSLEEKRNMLNKIYKNLNQYTKKDKNIIYKSILNGFRRTWIAKKKTVIGAIHKAKSLNEVKYILNDPKYSHISRWPNNKWWREISAMIDEIMAWYLPITFLPPEVRKKLETL